MQNKELSHPKGGEKGHSGWLCPAPSQSSLWPISRIPCPSRLRDNYSEQPWRRTGPLRQQLSTYMPIYTTLLLGWCSSSLIWLLPIPASLRVICSWKSPVSVLFRTSPSLTPLPCSYPTCACFLNLQHNESLQLSSDIKFNKVGK